MTCVQWGVTCGVVGSRCSVGSVGSSLSRCGIVARIVCPPLCSITLPCGMPRRMPGPIIAGGSCSPQRGGCLFQGLGFCLFSTSTF